MIQVKNLKKSYGDVHAVKDVSFEVERGQIMGFLGPNGAGKTTTIRCMMDFVRPDAGSVTIHNLNAFEDSVGVKRIVSYVAGETRLYENWTGADHIWLVSHMRELDPSHARELVHYFDLDTSKKVRQLSSGNKQKLSLILAFLADTPVIILDEPTTGLDPFLQNKVYDFLHKRVEEESVSVLMSSHNLAEVEKVCSQVAIIRDGVTVEVESIQNLRSKKLYSIEVFLREISDETLEKIKTTLGVSDIIRGEQSIRFHASMEANDVVGFLHSMDLQDVEITHAPLEDIFMQFYDT